MTGRTAQFVLPNSAIPTIAVTGSGITSPGKIRRSIAPRRDGGARLASKIDRVLAAMHKAGRRLIAILDAGCANGRLLITTALRARELGFVAIEAKGIDRSPEHVARAREVASAIHDPAIGLNFAVHEGDEPIPVEDEEDFDLTLVDETEESEFASELRLAAHHDGHVLIHR